MMAATAIGLVGSDSRQARLLPRIGQGDLNVAWAARRSRCRARERLRWPRRGRLAAIRRQVLRVAWRCRGVPAHHRAGGG
ncbi:hypothetical protein ACU4GD_20470 [Cupriavidus basilensis]